MEPCIVSHTYGEVLKDYGKIDYDKFITPFAFKTRKDGWFYEDKEKKIKSKLSFSEIYSAFRYEVIWAETFSPTAKSLDAFHDINPDFRLESLRVNNIRRTVYLYKQEFIKKDDCSGWEKNIDIFSINNLRYVLNSSKIEEPVKRIEIGVVVNINIPSLIAPVKSVGHTSYCRQTKHERVARCLEVWQSLTVEQLFRGTRLGLNVLNGVLSYLSRIGVARKEKNKWFFVDISPLGLQPLHNLAEIRERAKQINKEI